MGNGQSAVRKDAGLAELIEENMLLRTFTLKPTVVEKLACFTNCTLIDIQDAFIIFEDDVELTTPGLDKAGFCRVFSDVMHKLDPNDMVAAFKLFDADDNGRVDLYVQRHSVGVIIASAFHSHGLFTLLLFFPGTRCSRSCWCARGRRPT